MGEKVTAVAGGCLCGAIRYRASSGPIRMLNCHCRDCQRANGAAYAALYVVPKAAFEMTGDLAFYKCVGGSGKRIERGFCPACGSPVLLLVERAPEVVALQAASLDDPSVHRPAFDIYTDSAQHWDLLALDRPRFGGDFRRPD